MRVLIDTNVAYWTIVDSSRVSKSSRHLLEDPDNEFWVSAISFAEVHIKAGIGKLKLPSQFDETIVAAGYSILPFRPDHARWLSELPLHHRDPFDRMLIAQAIEEGMKVLTSDEKFQHYPISVVLN